MIHSKIDGWIRSTFSGHWDVYMRHERKKNVAWEEYLPFGVFQRAGQSNLLHRPMSCSMQADQPSLDV